MNPKSNMTSQYPMRATASAGVSPSGGTAVTARPVPPVAEAVAACNAALDEASKQLDSLFERISCVVRSYPCPPDEAVKQEREPGLLGELQSIYARVTDLSGRIHRTRDALTV